MTPPLPILLTSGLPGAALCLAAGLVLGALDLRGLRWQVRLIETGSRAPLVSALGLLRCGVAGGALLLAAWSGAPALLALGAGLLLVRFAVLRAALRHPA